MAKSLIIGIDPDIEMSGFAAVGRGELFQITSMTVTQIIDYVDQMVDSKALTKDQILVRVEAGHKNKSVWSGGVQYRKEASKSEVAKIAVDVGRNMGVGITLIRHFKERGIDVEEVVPKTKGRKIDAAMLQKMCGWTSRTNQDQRDAAILVIPYIAKKKK
jgi:hypothetical protein